MDFKKARIILKKISALTDSLSLNGGKIAPIERDLMLSYIRQLYEAYLDAGAEAPSPMPFETKKAKKKKKRIELKLDKPSKKAEPKPDIKIIKEEKPEPQIIKPEPEIIKPEPLPEVEKTPAPEPVVDKAPVKKVAMSREMRSLFDFKAAKELSEKLSEKPIADLTKELAINDRLLYANDLFGKSQEGLTKALADFNNMSSLDDALPHFVQLANQYSWLDGEKREVARSFIKLVRRRYK